LDLNNIFPPESNPYGLTYKEHVVNFWKYLLSIPSDQNPINDKTGEMCANGQTNSNSSVFYLANGRGKSERTCTLPSGKGVLIPVMVVEVSDKEVQNATEEKLHKVAKKDQDSVTSLYLRIDDKEYDKNYLSKFRTHTDAFDVVFPENMLYSAAPGKSKAVADGYYIITDVLPKGKHEVHYKSSLTCQGEDCLEPNFEQDIKYALTVE
jgi:hypothetical protein